MKKLKINGPLVAVIITVALVASGITYGAVKATNKPTPPEMSEKPVQTHDNPSDEVIDPVYSDGYKSIYFYSYQQLEKAFSHSPSANDADLLQESKTWRALGLQDDYQELAINAANQQKVPHLLTKIENDDRLYLKLIIIDKPSIRKAEYGIGNEDELNDFGAPNTNTRGHNNNRHNSNTSSVHPSGIYDFEIQIDYRKNNSDIELEYQVKHDGRVQIQYDNEQVGVYSNGNDAETLANKILEIDFKNTNQSDIINNILKAFDAPGNYEEIEVDVRYDDGTIIDFEHHQ